MRKIKETYCYNIHASPLDESREATEVAQTKYALPDGNFIMLKDEKMLAPEILFNPSMIGLEHMSFPEVINSALNKVDIELRNYLYQHINLAGGNTMFGALPDKVISELKKIIPKNAKVVLHAPSNRINSCWYGGSIITSLGNFKSMWVTKSDYLEKGDREIFTKTI